MLRNLGASVGEGVFIGGDFFAETEWARLLTIEDGVVIARGGRLILHDSSLTNVADYPSKVGRITLRKECYLGAFVTVLPGVEIGHHSIVGAGSVVTKDIPAETVAAGVPARVICTLDELKTKYETLMDDPNTRFGYWKIPAWRSHLGTLTPEQHQSELDTFLEGFLKEEQTKKTD